tara:strand:+ start:8425 stop:8631 length:207 start_codon:yes stop_codon:yes gene_type:complete
MEDLEDGSVEKDRRAYGGGPRNVLISKNKASAEKYVRDICKQYPLGEFLRTFQGGRLLEQPEEREDGS